MTPSVTLLLLLILTIFLASVLSKKAPRGLRRPPGPRGLPLIGSTLQLGKEPQQQLLEWTAKYGEIFQVQLGLENWVFLSSPGAVKDIMDKQSSITSGRPPQPVVSELVSNNMRLVMMSYTPEWRKLRTIVHKLLTPKSSNSFKPSQEFEAKQLIYDLLTRNDSLEEFYMHVRRYTTSVIMTATYGKRVPVWDCDDVLEVYRVMEEFSECIMPGTFIANIIPPLTRIPSWMQWWRKRALGYYQRQVELWSKHWNGLRDQIAQGKAPECFVKGFMETDYKAQKISELQGAFVSGTMIEAGSETTSSTLNSCIKYLAANPRVQERANEELTRVIGETRSPTFDDEESLPYIRAIGKEILRLRPVNRFGPPHYTTADVVYKDLFIPKNTILSVAQYVLHLDPSRYEDPLAFKPERYLEYPLKAGAYIAHPDPYARDHFSFGSGRRVCPGMHLAENSLFITIAKILWAFEIKPPLDETGHETTLDTSDEAYEAGMNTLPKPFKVRFVPRNELRRATLINEWVAAQQEGFSLGDMKVNVDGVVA